MAVPERINHHYIPVGEPYDISLEEYPEGVSFAEDYAALTFSYKRPALLKAGLIEDFMVFFYDADELTWKPIDYMEYDSAAETVTAYTSHFTTFVLTAIPSPAGTTASPPACIAQDFPSGIGGTGGTEFTVIDSNFKYYKDRDYFIMSADDSAENAKTFADLGFEGALGIATCNGDSACGPQSQHKLYEGDNYINFTAHADIDVYVMYDTRGGTGGDKKMDISRDAPWLAGSGFTADINGQRYFVETTDNVQYYTVYRKSYLKDETVTLHGNRREVTDTKIQTNYWVIIKEKDDFSQGRASDMCVAEPDTTPPSPVSNLKAVPGSNIVILTWQNPDDADFAGVVIRRSASAPPMSIGEGDAPAGVKLSAQAYRDQGLTPNKTYYYSIFSLDKNNNYQIGASVTVTTSKDSDGDGISDVYEISIGTNPNNADSDGDGITDGAEIAAGTDPLNSDNTAPVISSFARTSSSPTGNRTITFTIEGSNNIAVTGWMVTQTSTKPLAGSTAWLADKPLSYTVPGAGDWTLYAWAKDAAGNVSAAVFITAQITADEASLDGRVKDTGGSPVANALVSIFNGSGYEQHTSSSADGYYCFYSVPSGTYYVTARRDGYTYFTAVVTIP
jgi:hypothetical protein